MTQQPRYIREAHIRAKSGILPMGRTKFRQMIAAGELPKPTLLIGKCSYWLESEVLAAIDRLAEQQRQTPPIHGNLKHQRPRAADVQALIDASVQQGPQATTAPAK